MNRRPQLRRDLALAALLSFAACGPIFGPLLDAVDPVDTARALPTVLTASGEQFETGARLHLIRQGDSPIVLPAQVDPDGTAATAAVPTGMEPGVYDVRIVNPGGASDTIAGAFTIYDGGLQITFLDVDQGDATLIRSPRGDTLLKDAGARESGSNVVIPFLSRRGALPPTNILLSHRHEDHMGGITAILDGQDGIGGTADDRGPSGLLLYNRSEPVCSSPSCSDFEAGARRHGGRAATINETIDLGAGVMATVVAVDGHLADGRYLDPQAGQQQENASSMAIVVTFGELRVFVGGDLTGGGFETVDMETPLSAAIAPIHVLRANHHGSATSTNEAFAMNLEPLAAVVSAGHDNPYCHPRASVLNRLARVGARTFMTTPGIENTSGSCAEPTPLRHGEIVANGHIRMESDDGRAFFMGPLDGDMIDLRAE